MVAPAMIDTTSVAGPANGFSVGAGLAKRYVVLPPPPASATVPAVLGRRIEPNALGGQRGDLRRRRCGSITDDAAWRSSPLRQPARQHRAAHLAGAGKGDGAAEMFASAVVARQLSPQIPRRPGARGDP